MNLEHYNFPIEKHYTWEILDPSKITCYLECPRKFFYDYLLGWRPTEPNNHIVFGSAWHLAMEHLLLNGYDEVSIADAFDKFLQHYRADFPETTDETFWPKTPERALEALVEYSEKYKGDLNEFEVLFTEISATVPLSEEHNLHLRMDSIVKKHDGTIYSLEHKTAGSGWRFDEKWP